MRNRGDAFAGRDLVLCIGGVLGHLELIGANQPFLDQVFARYEAFRMPAPPNAGCDFSLRLMFHSAPPPSTRDVIAEADAHPLAVKAMERSIAVKRWDLDARLRARGRGRRAIYRGHGRCEMHPMSLDCILRVVWSTLLPRVGGMLVHSCGLRHAEVAVVFPGASGAGKTTLARKAPDPDDVLSDEICAIRRSDEGWRVHGTPFWGDFARGGISMRSRPLRTLAFLAQAPRDAVTMTPIVSAEAAFRLLGCFVSYAADRATTARNVALAVQLTSEVRSVEASLTKKVPAPAIFRKLAPHIGPEATRTVPALNRRELISDFCWFLRKHGSYSFPNGRRLRIPGAKAGAAITVRRAAEADLAPGDIGLYWRPGRTADHDTLVCRRVGPRVSAAAARRPRPQALGKVELRVQEGKVRQLPKSISDLSARFDPLVPLLTPRAMGTT